MTQKILAAKAGLDSVRSGEIIQTELDLIVGNDVTAPIAIKEFQKIGVNKVFDRDKIALVPDHFTPNKDICSAENCKFMEEFAREKQIKHYFKIGEMGIEHVLIPEQGLVMPGDVVIGADSHTCTYGALGAFSTGVGSTDMAAAMATGKCWFKVPSAIQFRLKGSPSPSICGKDIILHIIGRIGVDGARYKSMEFCGDGIKSISMDSRFTIANMAVEAGAKNGIFPVDQLTMEFIHNLPDKNFALQKPDKNAVYEDSISIDLGELKPVVAAPHLPENTIPVDEVGDIFLNQVVIGSCTNGRMEDLRTAAAILKGHKAAPNLRLIIIPGTQNIYLQALREGLITIFIEAGAAVSTPTCGPCLGGHMGVLAKNERALATTNRNFVGRMGHPESEVYLAGPAVAAASAINGKITSPDKMK